MTGLQQKTYSMAPLHLLRFGSEASPPIDVRRTGREADIAELAASIAAHGLKTPLQVKEIDGSFYVADGNRRLAALRKLDADADPRAITEVKCELLSLNEDAEPILADAIEYVRTKSPDTIKQAGVSLKGVGEIVLSKVPDVLATLPVVSLSPSVPGKLAGA